MRPHLKLYFEHHPAPQAAPVLVPFPADTAQAPAPPRYTVDVVSPYPGGEPDEYLDGQTVGLYESLETALDRFEWLAEHPAALGRLHAVPRAAFLVLNDRRGRELAKRAIPAAIAPVKPPPPKPRWGWWRKILGF